MFQCSLCSVWSHSECAFGEKVTDAEIEKMRVMRIRELLTSIIVTCFTLCRVSNVFLATQSHAELQNMVRFTFLPRTSVAPLTPPTIRPEIAAVSREASPPRNEVGKFT